MSEPKETIFMDKIKLASTYIIQEKELIELYSNLISLVREQKINEDGLLSEQNEWTMFWKQLLELYDGIKNDYLDKLKDKEKEKIIDIIKKYRCCAEEMTIEEATEAEDIILKIMSLSGFHDVLRMQEDDDFADI